VLRVHRYHDEVWGTRTYDDSAMFEALTLGVFEVGLSWSIVFGKRDAFRKAFRGVYAFMQNVGVVNDHVHGCFRAVGYTATAPAR
jgi:3-methyladenine DNA glycosylase Tag